MTKRLSDEDGRAVDLLLDRSGDGNYASPAGVSFHERVHGAEKILEALAEMPAIDPPADLVARTLRRIEESNSQDAVRPGLGQIADDSRPLA